MLKFSANLKIWKLEFVKHEKRFTLSPDYVDDDKHVVVMTVTITGALVMIKQRNRKYDMLDKHEPVSHNNLSVLFSYKPQWINCINEKTVLTFSLFIRCHKVKVMLTTYTNDSREINQHHPLQARAFDRHWDHIITNSLAASNTVLHPDLNLNQNTKQIKNYSSWLR